MRSARFIPAAMLLVVSLSSSVTCFAQNAQPAAQPPASQDTPAKQEAARRFEHAIKLYEEADYVLALAEFERVYELVPNYRVLYNIGQVSMQLGRYARALRTLREYAKTGGSELSPERAAAVQADLELLAGRTAQISVEAEPIGAEISIDGTVVGTAPLAEPLVVDVGERTLLIKLPGYVARSQTFSLAGGDRRDSQLVLEPEQAAVVQPRAQPTERPSLAQHGPTKQRSWTWLGWSSAGALATGALVAGGLGASAAGDLKDLRARGGVTRVELEQAAGRARTRLLIADALGAAAIVTGAVTLYVQLSSSTRQERTATHAAVRLALTPSQISLAIDH